MDEVIHAPQTGQQLDADLTAILGVLEVAPDNEGKVLYIRHGEIAFEDGEKLFDIIPL